jgi:hypothetical protein
MSCNIPTLNISVEDCAGDAAGKHNYNVLVLDTLVCNLSSTIIKQDNSIGKVYDELNSIINNFINIFPDYTNEKTNRFLTASTTVNLLSSVWQSNEFSLIYPMNGSNLYPDPSNVIDTPSVQKYTTATRPVQTTVTDTTYGGNTKVNLAFDTEYLIEDYESAVASSNGSTNKTGTISLLIDNVQVATYKASGKTKTGGDDTYVSWDQNNITTWENNKKYKLNSEVKFNGGTKFKFTKDTTAKLAAKKYSISAVKRGKKTTTVSTIETTEEYQTIDNIEALAKLQSRALTYLNGYFNPANFRNLTIVNLNMLISDIVANPFDKNQLISATYDPITFSRDNRSGATSTTSKPMKASFKRDNIYIQKNIILRYQVQNNIWVYIGKIE